MEVVLILILVVLVIMLFTQQSELKRRISFLERAVIAPQQEESHEVSHEVSHAVSHEVPLPLRASTESLEVLFGGKLLNRLGALATLIGLVFLFKWGVDNGWITETVRVITGLVVGLAAIAVGPRLERKGLTVFAQGVITTGIATCYLSLYAAFTYYHLIPGEVAYVGMAALTALALWRSIAHSSIFLATMSGVVGFSAPLALQTGVMNTGGLFTYLGFVAALMLGTVIGLRKWYSLYFVALGSTLLWWIVWSITGNSTDGYQQPAAAFSILADVVLFVGALYAIQLRASALLDTVKVIFTMIGLWFMCLVVDLTTYKYELWSEIGVSVVPLVVVSIAWLLVRRNENGQNLAHGLGILFIAVACLIPWTCHYDNNAQDLTLIVIAVVGTILGRRMRYGGMRTAADIIMALQLLWLLASAESYDLPLDVHAFANTTMLHYLLIAGYAWFLAERVQGLRQLAPAILIYALSFQTKHALHGWGYPSWIQEIVAITAWTVLNGVVVLIVRRYALRFADLYALIAIALGVLMWLAISLGHPSELEYVGFFNVRVISGVSITAVLLLTWYTVPRPTWKFNDALVIWPSILLVTFMLTTMETITPFMVWIDQVINQYGRDDGAVTDLRDRMQLLLSCAWIVYAAIVVAIGFGKRVKVARLAGMGVLGVAVLKVFVYDLSNLQTPFRIISFIVLGLILFGASYLYARFKDRIIA